MALCIPRILRLQALSAYQLAFAVSQCLVRNKMEDCEMHELRLSVDADGAHAGICLETPEPINAAMDQIIKLQVPCQPSRFEHV